MGFLKTFAATAVLAALIPNSAALNVDSKSNVAVYYGQGAYQPRLSHFCQETSLDIINLGFINVFPKAVGDWPGSNFGNQCDGTVYEGTELLSGCHQIWEDIPICKELGKTVMLSLGGETAYEDIPTDEVAEWFADFLWYSFGPPGQNDTFPRPFQDNQVDGFDFDIEHYGGHGYATMIQRLRSHFADFPDETFYISGAPQCQLPDAQLSDAISNSHFDFIWVQWYNTAACSATNFLEGNGLFNFAAWAKVIQDSANPAAKLFVGLPASEEAAVDGFYLSPAEVYPLVDIYMNLYPDMFGGIMLWEATASDNNTINGYNYAQHMKHILHECDPSPPPTSTSTIFVTPTSKPVSSTPSSSAVQTSSQTPSSAPVSSSQPTSSSTYVASSTASPSSPPASSVTPTIVSSSAAHSSTSIPSSNPVTGSSSSPAASHSVSSSTTSESSIQTPASSHSHPASSNTSGSEKPSTKPTATPSETPCSTRRQLLGLHRALSPGLQYPAPPSSTGTHLSPSGDSSASASLSTTSGPAISSTEVTGVSPGSTVTTGGSSATGVESSTGPQSTGNGSQTSTSPQSTDKGGESTTGPQSTGNGGESQTGSSVTVSPSVTAAASTTTPPTVTTIIVTSYTDICPTGFTTITTTITTTICPEATAGVTNPPSGPASTTPSIPEGWTTTVKVCDNCAPTPTTVTLTVPNPIQTTEVAVQTSPVLVTTETWTTTVTFCKHCGVTGSSVTLTVPYTTVISTAVTVVTPGASPEQGEVTVPGGLPQTTAGNSQGAVPSHGPSSSWSYIKGGVHSPSQTPTFKVHASTTQTVQNPAPTGSGEGVSPVFNAAGSQSGLMSLFGVSLAAVLSICLLI
ncbi:hypothetical protein N7509_012113 [Penicillium cosmopolitanum]|uniref:chitinase n=1 Tax=Penicillium cosmopolitanum TaxID=1131564 RepID=A0A9W9SKL4_9EURO|nr:uncharacterized protein N7509_012113 [Penicillium cosmopolitanum]KAJ5378994.1 hypothetical protein N7509_012113 [Penicillium cosmopolitanum]